MVQGPQLLTEGDKVTLGEVTFKFSFQDEDDTHYHIMLRNMAIKDGLTRIYNKRYFEEALDKEFDYNRRNKSGLGLIFFDIDHFKEVNDTHGHPAGDYILKHLAQLIEHEARGYDLFARYGGEEFVFMMRGGTAEAAMSVAERVRLVIAGHVFTYDNIDLQVTVSLGVSFWAGEDCVDNPTALVEFTDKLLYEAKDAGRNCARFRAIEC
jgi:two-component system, cell cycle response regulator